MRSTKKHYVYLSGSIAADSRTFAWREEFENLINERDMPIVVLNPCRSKFDQDMLIKCDDSKRFWEEAQKIPFGVLKRKDRQMVKISSVVVVNLEIINPDKPVVGTLYELAWADEFRLPVIAISKAGVNEMYTKHPFIMDSISETVGSVVEAVDVLDNFFVDY